MNLRMGHFWGSSLFSRLSPMVVNMSPSKPQVRTVILDAEFVEDDPAPEVCEELEDEDIIEHIFEETGVDFTDVEYEDEGDARMASNERNQSERDVASLSRP